MRLFTASGLLLTCGYARVEFGGRGPYLELTEAQVQKVNLHGVPLVKDRHGYFYKHTYYDELRSNCDSCVKVYYQRRTVEYADYRIGFYYVSPFALRDENGNEIVAQPQKLFPCNTFVIY